MSPEQTVTRTISLRGGEILVALLLIVMCVLAWIETNTFEPETGMVKTLGPAIFPRILLGGIAIGSVMILVQALRSKSTETVSFGPWHKIPMATCLMLFQALSFEELSTFVTAGLTLPSLLWIAGVNPKTISHGYGELSSFCLSLFYSFAAGATAHAILAYHFRLTAKQKIRGFGTVSCSKIGFSGSANWRNGKSSSP